FFFFFSSRRRHTRSKRDWSSDVCSSDLGGRLAARAACRHHLPRGHVARADFEPQRYTLGLPLEILGAGLEAVPGIELHTDAGSRSEEHTSELQSRFEIVCRLLLEKKKLDISGDAPPKPALSSPLNTILVLNVEVAPAALGGCPEGH